MKKMKYFWGCLVIISIISTSCSENDDLNDIRGNAEGKYIEFALRRSSTRTIYDDQDGSTDTNDDWQINWEENDPIRIYCAEAKTITQSSNAEASYKVTDIAANNGSLTKINENALQWGTASTHDFFAVFPDDGKKIAGYDHTNKIITFNFNANQTIKEVKEVDGNYIAVPDMNNALMVASTIGVQNGKTVNLEFVPIMTTLEINVKGQPSVNTIITGVSVITTFPEGSNLVIDDEGKFKYDIDAPSPSIVLSTDKALTETKQTIFIEIPNGVVLTGENTLNVTAFIPPITLGNNTQIQIHSTRIDGGKESSIGVSRRTLPISIPPSYKKILNLPNLPSPATNDWISALDDNIYVSELSIPGSHDACTAGVESAIDAGRTQILTISEQLSQGIRAFDLRPALERSGGVLSGYTYYLDEICHGGYGTDVYLGDVMKSVDEYLDIHKDEFVILLCKNETADAHGWGALIGDKKPWAADGGAHDSEYKSEVIKFLKDNDIYQERKIAFRPDLTIGECRGKILLFSRDDLSPDGNIETAHVTWNHDNHINTINKISGTNGSCNLYVQDMFSPGENGKSSDNDYLTKKKELIKARIEQFASFYKEKDYTPRWLINHCSGYTGLNNYSNNASSVNIDIYNYIVNPNRQVGTLGIMLMDFIGHRHADYIGGNYEVYGELLPQAIIDNNFKYVMKRKSAFAK